MTDARTEGVRKEVSYDQECRRRCDGPVTPEVQVRFLAPELGPFGRGSSRRLNAHEPPESQAGRAEEKPAQQPNPQVRAIQVPFFGTVGRYYASAFGPEDG